MKQFSLYSRVLLGSSSALLASKTVLAAQTNVVPRLDISRSGQTASELVLSGAQGQSYNIETTRDFLSWTNWSTHLTDSRGIARIPAPLSRDRLFFRASRTEKSTRLSPEALLGKRFFLETRFAQFFFAHSNGDVNKPLSTGDPVLDQTVTLTVPVPGPFAGQSMNCRACHLFDEQNANGRGYRSYADFAIRSPIPDRGDGRKTTLRNSPPLANASIPRPGSFFLHFDGEFPDGVSLVKGTLTGRNFGWLATERAQAIAHIARVIREDDGAQFNGSQFGGAYRHVLAGDATVSESFRVPDEYRLDVAKASDDQVLGAIGRFVDTYMKSLQFPLDSSGGYEGSPYDLFLKKNTLPRKPAPGETDLAYSRRLRGLLADLTSPAFVTPDEGSFQTLTQAFTFGAKELAGLKMFLAEPSANTTADRGKAGNCISCHSAPHFTDFDFHNTGATQWEYDALHGEGAFMKISIPTLSERIVAPDDFLPATSSHPGRKGKFVTIASEATPGSVDLGVWNIYANDDYPASQPPFQNLFNTRFPGQPPDALLAKTIAAFKTPGLRGLDQSAPYMHTGQSSTIESLLFFYRFTSDLAREGAVRNLDPEIARIFLAKEDAPAVAAFLRSLNQDPPAE
jgi:hypothetical protein